ncbi:MAG: DciA family protein [Alphaproteobacteria bacterium]|nr:DciA family protein [Alphaproteobacteria bacterium]
MNTPPPAAPPARKTVPPPTRIQRGLLALGTMVSKVTMPLYRKRGFAEASILSDWPVIVGKRFAAVTLPEKLTFPKGEKQDGLLHVRVDGPLATELQHLEPQIVERINGYFGYHAVARLKLVQGPVPPLSKPAAAQPPPQADARTRRAISEMTTDIADEGLRTALADLGCAVSAEQEWRQDGEPSKKVKAATATAPKNLAGNS